MTLNRKRAGTAGSDGDSDAERGESGRPFMSGLLVFLFMGAAILVFGMLVARTAGFREIVAVKNEEWTQTRVGIQGSRIGWPYDLVLTEVTFPAKLNGVKAALFIPEVRAGWRPRQGLEIRLIHPQVRLTQAESGACLPEELAKLGEIRNAADLSDWLAPLKGRATLRIEHAVLEVFASSGESLRKLDDIRLDVSPVALPNRSAVHYDLRTGPMESSQARYQKLEQEWLACGESNVVTIAFAVDAAGKPWARDFWKGVQP